MVRAEEPLPGPPPLPRSVLLLGAGELAKELAISAQRLGLRVIAADRYAGAPAMHVSDAAEVLSLRDGTALRGVIHTHRPDLIIPEMEAISLETLRSLEEEGFRVAPDSAAAALAMDRAALRRAAREELGLRTPSHRLASSAEELREACDEIGFPCVVKPMTGYSGRGQSVVLGPSRVDRAWGFAYEEAIGDGFRVIVEELIESPAEVTILAIREWGGATTLLPPIGQRQERGGYRESWIPAELEEDRIAELTDAAGRISTRIGGAGILGIELLVAGSEVILSDVSAGPHDAGMVTMVSHDLSQFDLHVRATMGLPIPAIRFLGPSASAVILADREGEVKGYGGLERALQVETSQIRIFGRPQADLHGRMGLALACGQSIAESRARALEAASRVSVEYV